MHALALTALLAAAPSLSLSPGAQEVLKVPGLQRVAVSDPAIADVTPTGKGELLVVAHHVGRTSLTLWTPGGVVTRTVVVDDGRTSELGRAVRETVSPSLQVSSFNGHVVIDGTVDSVEELRRLRTLVGDDASVRLLVRMNPRVLPLVAEQVTAAWRKEGIREARAVAVGGKLLLEGAVADELELKRALAIADALAGGLL
jgi:Flp pilus assembly secretin CpaC